jgi:transposase
LDLELPAATPGHSTIARTRRLMIGNVSVGFTWIFKRLAEAGLVRGKTIGMDATTLEANAAFAQYRAARYRRPDEQVAQVFSFD